MKEHQFNLKESQKIRKEFKNLIKPKECYNNIFKVSTEMISKFNSNQYKVAYGYVPIIENLLARHCFIINEYSEAIDPTILDNKFNKLYSFKIFEDYQEYISILLKENGEPSLPKYFRKQQEELLKWANENNFILIG